MRFRANAGSAAVSAASRKHLRYLLLILLIAAVNFSVSFGWGLPQSFNSATTAPWSVDTVASVPPLTEAYHRFTRRATDPVVYPLFHYVVLGAAYAPYVVGQYLLGNMPQPSSEYPYGVLEPTSFFHSLTIIARIVSLSMALGIVVLAYKITRELFCVEAALWSALMTALLSPMAYYSTTANLDVPYLFWVMAATWQYTRVVRSQSLKHYVAFGACGALAIATKDQAYGFFVLTPILLVYALAHHRGGGRVGPQVLFMALVSRPIIVTGVVTLTTFAFANNLVLGGWDGFVRHLEFAQSLYEYRNAGVPIASLAFQRDLMMESGDLLLQMLGYVSLLICLAGVAYALYRRNWLGLSLLVFVAGYYVACLAVAGLVLPRYMLGPALLLIPFGGYLVHQLANRGGWVRSAGLGVAAVACLTQLLLCINLNLTLVADSRYRLESWVRANVPRAASIESQIQWRYLPHLADQYELAVVGNSMDPVTYAIVRDDLTPQGLASRNPDYIVILQGLGVTGDPLKTADPSASEYYRALLAGELGYRTVAEFDTPSYLPFKQVTSGTQPTSILLARSD